MSLKAEWKTRFPERTCSECGASFTPVREGGITCSDACYKARKYRLAKEARARKRAGIGPTGFPAQRCSECEKEFFPGRSDVKTCSPKCSAHRMKRKWRESEAYHERNAPSLKTEQEQIDKMRAALGMKPLKRGTQTCGCGKTFKSDDMEHERLCDRCKRLAEVYYSPPTRHHARVGGGY